MIMKNFLVLMVLLGANVWGRAAAETSTTPVAGAIAVNKNIISINGVTYNCNEAFNKKICDEANAQFKIDAATAHLSPDASRARAEAELNSSSAKPVQSQTEQQKVLTAPQELHKAVTFTVGKYGSINCKQGNVHAIGWSNKGCRDNLDDKIRQTPVEAPGQKPILEKTAAAPAAAETAVQSPSISKQKFTAAEIKERQRRVEAGLPPSDSAVEVKDSHEPVATQQKAAALAQNGNGNTSSTSSTDKLISDSLSGKSNKDLGIVPGVTKVGTTPASTTTNLSNSAKNLDGTARSPASTPAKVEAPAVAAKPATALPAKENKTGAQKPATSKNATELDKQLLEANVNREITKRDLDTATSRRKELALKVSDKEQAAENANNRNTGLNVILAKNREGAEAANSALKKTRNELAAADTELKEKQKAFDKANTAVNDLSGKKVELNTKKQTEEKDKRVIAEAAKDPSKANVEVAAGCTNGDKNCTKDAKQTTAPTAPEAEATAEEKKADVDKKLRSVVAACNDTASDECAKAQIAPGVDPKIVAKSIATKKANSNNKPGSQAAVEPDTKSVCDTAGEPQTDFAQFKGVNAGPGFSNCILVTQGKIFDYTKINTVDDWINFYCAIENINEKFGGGKKQNSKHVMTRSLFLKSDEFMNAQKCMMGAHILKNAQRDYKNGDHTQSSSKEKGDEYGCKTSGYDTVDYDDCVAFKDHAVAADTAKAVATQVQTMKYQMDMQDEQLKASKSPDQATASLTSQKTSFEKQQQMMNQQAAVEAATFALLENDKANMPDVETIKGWCSDVTSKLPASDLNLKKDTCEALASNRTFDFLMNEKSNEAMKKKLIKVGADAALDLLRANMLGKNAEQVGNAIAAIKGITPTAPTGPTMADMQAQLCQLSPTDPSCNQGGLTRTFGSTSGDAINFSTGGQGSIYSPGELNPNTSAGGGAGSALGTPNAKGSFGTNTVAAPHAGGLKDTAAAAQFDNKGGGASGGGGGGGGATGGGGGGGGGPTSGGAGGGVQSAVAGRAPGYGGGGGFSMMGGFGIGKGGKTADTGNPFGKMFDKGPKGDMNFRAPASAMGNKNDNIFEMITKRYNNVSTDKRLMEYEQAK